MSNLKSLDDINFWNAFWITHEYGHVKTSIGISQDKAFDQTAIGSIVNKLTNITDTRFINTLKE